MNEKKLLQLEKSLGIIFKDKNLLKQSLVHRSYLNEHSEFELGHNERLEFLGDAVLEFVVTEYLYLNYLNPEGELTNWRASLVNSHMLTEMAEDFNLDKYLYLSKGESKDTGKARSYILANAFEALLGAIYLDQGIKVIEDFIKTKLLVKLDHIIKNKLYLDPKSKIQEVAQEKMSITPNYRVLSESGPDHSKSFEVGVYLNDKLIAVGNGSSKQEAQVNAAKLGLESELL